MFAHQWTKIEIDPILLSRTKEAPDHVVFDTRVSDVTYGN